MSISSSARRPASLTARQRARNSALGVLAPVDRRRLHARRAPAAAPASRRSSRGARRSASSVIALGICSRLATSWIRSYWSGPGSSRADDRRDRAQRVVAPLGRARAGRVERPLDLEARHRHRRLEQRAHRRRPVAAARRRPDPCPAGSRTTRQVEPAQVVALVEVIADRVLALRRPPPGRRRPGPGRAAPSARAACSASSLVVGQRRAHRADRLGDRRPGAARSRPCSPRRARAGPARAAAARARSAP